MALTQVQTAQSIITKALRSMNSYAPGESLQGADASDALDTLNDLLDSWSSEKLMCFQQVENIFNLTSGQYQYTIGAPWSGIFTGTVTSGSGVITGVTVPSTLAVGAFLQDAASVIPAGAHVTAIGSNTVTFSPVATASSPAAEQIQFTVNGSIYQDAVTLQPIKRPIRITAGFTRITPSGNPSLDYPFKCINVANYSPLGLKGLPGPWPTRCYYNPSMPAGTLYFYPNPQQAGEVHLWTDVEFTAFAALTTPVSLPNGYIRALRFNLACDLWPEYFDDPVPEQLKELAFDAKKLLEDLNAEPQAVATYDADMVRSKRPDASWIMDGGFR